MPQTTQQQAPRPQTAAERLGHLLLGLPVGVAVVDRQYDIQTINSAAHRLLGIFRSSAGQDLIHLSTSVPSALLRSVIDATFRASPSTHADTVITVETVQGERRYLQIACYPQRGDVRHDAERGGEDAISAAGPLASAEEHPQNPDVRAQEGPPARVIVLITDVTRTEQERRAAQEVAMREARIREEVATRTKREREQAQTQSRQEQEQASLRQREEIERLTQQLDQVSGINRELLEANEELTSVVIELRGSNEELLISHEEVQASAEEIKTLNEEMQATNEELETLNEEMEATNEELHTTNDDLQARSIELQALATSLEQQRQATEAERARLSAILLSMSDALLVVDVAGAIVLTNAAYATFFGSATAVFIPEDEEGRALPPDVTPQQRAARGEAFSMIFSLTGTDGSRREFEAVGRPIGGMGSNGEERGGVVTIRDVTERSLHRLQDQFISLAAHELRSPLTTVLAALQMLAKEIEPGTSDDGTVEDAKRSAMKNERVRRHVSMALHEGQRLKLLINDLVDVERLRHGKLSLRREPVDLVAFVRQVAERFQLNTERSQLIRVEIDGDRTGDGAAHTLMVRGDTLRLEQVLGNLLTNAAKYAPSSEHVELRLQRVRGAKGTDADLAEIEVEDYGAGIAQAALPHVFTRFYQGTRKDMSGQTGLGLGLFIVRELVEAHGGTITVRSQEGSGTCFTIRLPVLQRAQVWEKGKIPASEFEAEPRT